VTEAAPEPVADEADAVAPEAPAAVAEPVAAEAPVVTETTTDAVAAVQETEAQATGTVASVLGAP
jgi:hypothetical protein